MKPVPGLYDANLKMYVAARPPEGWAPSTFEPGVAFRLMYRGGLSGQAGPSGTIQVGDVTLKVERWTRC